MNKVERVEYNKQWQADHPDYGKQRRANHKLEITEYRRQWIVEHPLYNTWSDMKQRCYNSNLNRYKNYGGRGIKVCNEWLDYKEFEKWCLEHGWQPNLTIDRMDNNGNYEPSNCQFLTRSENSKKRGREK